MKITTLIEDTMTKDSSLSLELTKQHGLSLYIETIKHRILFDTGANGAFACNAKVLGVDLAGIDTAVISHGHYDHGGGIKTLLEINKQAPIYIRTGAFNSYWHVSPNQDVEKYIGLDRELITSLESSCRLIEIMGNQKIDDELSLITDFTGRRGFASTNRQLKIRTNNGYIEDSFLHEQALVVRENGVKCLISGCAHNGILNILDVYENVYGEKPDIVISGMHLSRKDYSDRNLDEIDELANMLLDYHRTAGTRFYTCHCTGRIPYERMKQVMGVALGVLRTGTEISI